MKYILWIIAVFFLVSSLHIFALFGLPLVGTYLPYPLYLFRDVSANPYSTWSLLVFLNFLPFVGMIVSYLVYIFYAVVSIYIPNFVFSKKFLAEYKKYELIHKVSLLLSLPFLFPLGFVVSTLYFFHSDIIFGPMEITLGIIIWIFWFRYSHSIFSRLMGLVATVFAICGIFFFMSESIPEFYPAVYGKFPLSDPKGVYMINYDGDYWLTYYSSEQFCWNKNDNQGNLEKVCKINLVKKGNTVITESPVDLKKYLDKPLRIEGDFVPIMPPVLPGNGYRQFCVIQPVKRCTDSKGPGTWYFSPLKIRAIQ